MQIPNIESPNIIPIHILFLFVFFAKNCVWEHANMISSGMGLLFLKRSSLSQKIVQERNIGNAWNPCIWATVSSKMSLESLDFGWVGSITPVRQLFFARCRPAHWAPKKEGGGTWWGFHLNRTKMFSVFCFGIMNYHIKCMDRDILNTLDMKY